jgi:PAS domain S-box-containing protein
MTTKLLKYLIVLFMLLITPLHIYSQKYAVSERWRWTNFTVEDGLPSNAVFSIVEAPDGTPWVNTQAGLAWYNGYCWETIDSLKGLPAQQMQTIIVDGNDSLLVIDRTHKLYYGGKHGFRPVRLLIDGKEELIGTAAKYYDGRFLFLSRSSLFIGNTELAEKYELPDEFKNQKILGIWNTGGNSIWMNASAGLYRMENNRWHLKLPSKIESYSILQLWENINGYGLAFIASPPGDLGLWEWSPTSDPEKMTSEGIEVVTSLDINNDNDRIILKEIDLLKIYTGDRWFVPTQLIPEIKNIFTVKFRRNGGLWIGTVNGLHMFSSLSRQWTTLKYPSPDERNKINELISTRDGSIWAATSRGVVTHKPDGAVVSIEAIDGKTIDAITGIVEDNEGNIWISSGRTFEGTYKWDGKRWTYYGLKDGLDAGNVHKIRKDNSGRLWFLGLYRTDFYTRNVEQEPDAYLFENNTFIPWGREHGLPAARYYAFEEEPNGIRWFGTSIGLFRWTPDKNRNGAGTIKRWSTDDRSLLNNRIFTIAIDSNKTLWFGDRWSGLGYLDNDTIKYLTTADGLVSNDVWRIEVDNLNRLWIGTQGGLSFYSNGVFSSFKTDEGLENIRIWPILPLNNKIYIGTLGGGIQILDLAEINLTPPKISALPPMIEKRNAFIRWKTYTFWGTRFSENIETRSSVDDDGWTVWSRQHGIMLNDLSAGIHTVKVQSKNLLGATDTTQNLITFEIPAPFYTRPEFLIPIGALSAALAILTVVFVNRKRRADAALRRSEQRYRNLFDNANDAIMIIDPHKKTILEVNSKACEIYGYTKDEFISLPFSEVTKINGGAQDELLWNLHETGSKKYETTHNTQSGRHLNMHINAALIEFEGKTAILTLHRDISDIRQAEAKIRLLAQTITSARDYISITALDNTILFVNDAFAEGHGYTGQELFGMDFSVVLSPLTPQEKIDQLSATRTEGSWNGEIFHRRKDGTNFPVEVWSAVVQGEENQPVAVVHVARDVTDRKKAETDRENLILELQNALVEVKTLSGLLPICANCKKIRDDHGYWIQVETYISKHSEATFTHGLCPDCLKQYYPEVYQRMKDKEQNK